MPLIRKPIHFSDNAYEKLQKFPSLESDLNAALDVCGRCASEMEIQTAFDQECRSRFLMGDVQVLHGDEILGHVKEESISLLNLADELSLNANLVKKYFFCLCGVGSLDDIRGARAWFEDTFDIYHGHKIKISRNVAWLFRPVTPSSDPFDLDLEDLPWRLALPRLAKARGIDCGDPRYFLGFRLKASSVGRLRCPTPFDSGYEGAATYWVPGGKTVPHAHGPDSALSAGGLKEVVLDPPYYGILNTEFVRFQNRKMP